MSKGIWWTRSTTWQLLPSLMSTSCSMWAPTTRRRLSRSGTISSYPHSALAVGSARSYCDTSEPPRTPHGLTKWSTKPWKRPTSLKRSNRRNEPLENIRISCNYTVLYIHTHLIAANLSKYSTLIEPVPYCTSTH